MPTQTITLTSAGVNSGPNYAIYWSSDCVNYNLLTGSSPIFLPSVGSTASVDLPLTTTCISLRNINSVCNNELTTSVQLCPTPTTTTTSTTTIAPTTTTSTTSTTTTSTTSTSTTTTTQPPSTTTTTGTPQSQWTASNYDCGGGTLNDVGINGSFMGTLSGPSTFPLTSTLYGYKTNPNGINYGGSNTIQANVTTNLPGTGNCAVLRVEINGVTPTPYETYFTSNPFPQVSGVVINPGDQVWVYVQCYSGSCPATTTTTAAPTTTTSTTTTTAAPTTTTSTTTTTQAPTTTTTTDAYDYYVADEYDCNGCTISTYGVLVGFPVGTSVTVGKFYRRFDDQPFVYEILEGTGPGSPAVLLKTPQYNTCTQACAAYTTTTTSTTTTSTTTTSTTTTTTAAPTTTTTTGASATLYWSFSELRGANGIYDLYINSVSVETRNNTASGTYTVYVGDVISVGCNADQCTGGGSTYTNIVVTGEITDAACQNNGSIPSYVSPGYTVVSGDVGTALYMDLQVSCDGGCI